MAGNDREVNILLKLKQQLNAEFGSAAQQLEANIKAVNNASKDLNETQKKSSEVSKDQSINFVDIASKLYLVEVAVKRTVQALQFIYDLGKRGAELEQISTSFERVIVAAGGTTEVLEQLRQATRGTIADSDLMIASNQSLVGTTGQYREAMVKALPALAEMARASALLNPQFGDTTQQLDRLTLGLKRMEPRILDDIGLELRLTEVNKNYAEQIGKSASELTSEEKQLGLLNAVLERQGEYISLAGDGLTSVTDGYTKSEAAAKNLGDTVSKVLSPAITDVTVLFGGMASWTDTMIKSHGDLVKSSIAAAQVWQYNSNALGEYGKFVLDTARAEGDLEDSTKKTNDATKALTDQRREEVGATREQIDASVELANAQEEADNKFREKRNKSFDSLFIQQIKINQKIVDAERDKTDKLTDLAEEETDRLRGIYQDSERERTQISKNAAEDRLQIEQDYNDRKADLEKDLTELRMELEGKNPFVDEATTTAIKDQEALLKATKSNLETLKRDAKNGHAGPSMDAEIQQTEDLARQIEDNISQLKDDAREQERRNRILARIQEKEDSLRQIAEDRDREIEAVNTKEREKLEIVKATEAQKTIAVQEEYDKRENKIKKSFEDIRQSAEEDIRMATVDAMLSLVDTNTEIGKTILETKFKMLGATDEMINKYYQMRDAITGPGGVLQAVQQLNSISFSSLTSGYYNNSGNYSGGVSGRRASGGDVSGGHSYLVGENGPEIVRMGGNGTVIPNHAMGGGITVIVQAGAYLGNRSDAVAFGNIVGPIVADWQSRYGGATNAQGTRNIRSNR